MFRGLRNFARVLRLALTLSRFDALEALAPFGIPRWLVRLSRWIGRLPVGRRPTRGTPPGERLAQAFSDMGPTFIKLGQSLATRADLVGEDVAQALSRLQDKLAPFPAARARAIIEDELGKPIDALFRSFDDVPVAAASIAQVHFAETIDGDPVAVKVLRPDIEARFARDLDMLAFAARLIERARPGLRRLKPREVVATFARVVAMEMDLRLEAAAASELRENFAGDATFGVPEVDWRRTGQRVLTLERVVGIPIDERERIIAAGIDPTEVLEKAACAFFNQVFRDGFFHADLHPGNLFVTPEGNLMVVDFGIVGRLDWPTRRYLAEMLLGFLEGDYRRVADVHFEAGYIGIDQPRDLFMQACRSIGEPILGLPLNEISIARLLAQLFRVTETFQMETQPQLLLLQKTMMVAEGVGRQLNPGVNMWELSRPLVEAWGRENMGPEARIRDGLRDFVSALERLPNLLGNMERAVRAMAEREGEPPTDGDREKSTGLRVLSAPLWAIAGLLAALLAATALH